MKATYAVIPEEGVLRLETEDLDPADLGVGEILVEAEASIISAGTELSVFTALAPGVRVPGSWNAYPWRPGYGLVGHVLAVGAGVTGFSVGDRICCFGKHASLQHYDVTGKRPVDSAFAMEEGLSAAQGLVARMALIGLSALQMSDFEAGDTVAIFGLGLVGNLAAQLFQLAGTRVIAFDIIRARCRIASEVGIETALDVPAEGQLAALRDLTRGKGVAIAVDAVGHSAVVQACAEACAPFAQVILLGSPRAPLETDITRMLRTVHHRWLTLRGALEWRLPPYPVLGAKHSIASNLALLQGYIRADRLHVRPVITDVIPPTGLQAAYCGLLEEKERHLGIIVEWRSGATRDEA